MLAIISLICFMKKIIRSLFLLLVAISFGAKAQQVINHPKFSATTAPRLEIEKILLTDTATILYINSFYDPETWFRFSPDTYLLNGKNKLVVKTASGIELNKQEYMPASGKKPFTLSFPALAKGTKKIDLIECEGEDCFKIYDIELIASKTNRPLAAELTGNWFKTDGSKEWVLTLTDKVALYKNQIWNYTDVNAKGKKTVISLKNDRGNKVLYAEKAKDGNYKIGEKPNELTTYAHAPVKNARYIADETGFTLPVFKHDSVTYSGYFNGYSPKLGYKTGQAYVNNIFTGQQESYLININPDGSFHVRFPMNYPETIFIRFTSYSESVYFEPGENLFQYINLTEANQNPLFMGQPAELNREILEIRQILKVNYEEISKNTAALDPDQFKTFFDKMEQEKRTALDKYHAENKLSRKTYQQAEMNIIYKMAEIKADYENYWEQANAKSKTGSEKRILLDSSYYSFLKKLPMEDPLSVISNDFNSLINRIKFANIFYRKDEKAQSVTAEQTFEEFLKDDDFNAADKQFIIDFINKEKGTDKEKSQKDFALKYPGNKMQDFITLHEKKFSATASVIFQKRRMDKTKRIFQLKEDGLIANIMIAQDYSADLERNYIPFTDTQMRGIKKDVTNPFIYNVISNANELTKQKIASNKTKTGYFVNHVEKSAPDSLFANLMKKFKGKVVYVDFWATWCAPCRSGIERIAPLKEEMANDNVAFVYISAPTSPTETYNNMIANIKGEHFKVSTDEWNILCSQFKISGIPHYALVDKNGKVVNPHLPHMENGQIKKTLNELMK